MTQSLSKKVADFCRKYSLLSPKDSVVVGVSGGPDSICLLHLLTNIGLEFRPTLTVAHLNHQLRDEAKNDEAFIRDIARGWELPLFVEARNVTQLAIERRESIEETARQVRYEFLWRVAKKTKANKIAVGHNADDQVETVLMHFLRGAGLVGLRGILPLIDVSSLHLGDKNTPTLPPASTPKLIRPLLEISRAEIEDYCREHHLSPRRDRSNQDTTFFRNRLRHELIPQLETYNPNIRQVVQRMAKVVAADVEFLNKHIDQAWQSVVRDVSPENIEVDLNKWLSLPLAMKRSILRRAVHTLRRNMRDISFEHIEWAIAIIGQAGTGKKVTLPQGLVLTISYNTFSVAEQKPPPVLHLSNLPHLLSDEVLPLDLPGSIRLPHTAWQLRASLLPISHLDQAHISSVHRWETYLDADVVGKNPVLRPRRAGDKFSPLGLGGHHQKVSEFMVDRKIPVDERDHIPLLVTSKDCILWICGYRLDERARISSNTQYVLHLKFEQIRKN